MELCQQPSVSTCKHQILAVTVKLLYYGLNYQTGGSWVMLQEWSPSFYLQGVSVKFPKVHRRQYSLTIELNGCLKVDIFGFSSDLLILVKLHLKHFSSAQAVSSMLGCLLARSTDRFLCLTSLFKWLYFCLVYKICSFRALCTEMSSEDVYGAASSHNYATETGCIVMLLVVINFDTNNSNLSVWKRNWRETNASWKA